tara:strand:+ start:129 stop:1130 length:1002 start_codon:yes stop_codon:yes gene_type:complete
MKLSLSKKIITLFVATIISIVIAEVVLRIFGNKPWENIPSKDPEIYKSDSKLGWLAKKGNYIISPAHELGEEFSLNIEEDGQRNTDQNNEKYNNEILIVGGSFTQGWGVSDEDTFSSKLQKKYEDFKVYNFGQGGYGSLQSLLLLEKQIQKIKDPKLVIYGFIEHHEYRNVARGAWLRVLAKYSRRGHVSTPYASIGKNDELLIHSPISYINLPFREISSMITLIEKVYMKLVTKQRKKQQQIVTKKIVLQMKEVSNKFDSKFVLVMLDWNNPFTKDNYENFFKENKIKFVNCAVSLDGDMVILGDYHPSKKAHTHYSDCLFNYIKSEKILGY